MEAKTRGVEYSTRVLLFSTRIQYKYSVQVFNNIQYYSVLFSSIQ